DGEQDGGPAKKGGVHRRSSRGGGSPQEETRRRYTQPRQASPRTAERKSRAAAATPSLGCHALPLRVQHLSPADVDSDRGECYLKFGGCALGHLGEPEVEDLELLQGAQFFEALVRDLGCTEVELF